MNMCQDTVRYVGVKCSINFRGFAKFTFVTNDCNDDA